MATTRRDFIKNTTLGVGGFMIVPRHVLGKGFVAPSDRLNLAAVGIGSKGASDIALAHDKGANNVVALCDVDWQYGLKTFEKFPKATRYKDFREMLDKEKSIDAVMVATPDHTHAIIAMAAMDLGKHVYVQKPLAHNIFEARTMTETARRNKIVTQMGNQGASAPNIKTMIEWFDQGLVGKVHTVHVWTNRPVWPQGIPVPTDRPAVPADLDWDKWIGPASPVGYSPAYHPFKWRGWWEFGTGALGDMGCHLMDKPFQVLGLGYPTEVECSVGSVFLKDWTPEYIPEGCPPSSVIQMKFPATRRNKSAVTMTWSDGGLKPFRSEWMPADEFLGEPDNGSGVMIIGTKGVMLCGVHARYARLYGKNGKKIILPTPAELPDAIDAEFGHQTAWVNACKAGYDSPQHKALTSSFDTAGPLTEAVLMGNLAIRSYNLRTPRNQWSFDYPGRKKLLWDGPNMRITNYDDANQFVKRQ